MITSKSEYLFVSGPDMDLITIDGSIMPLRSGNTASGQPFQNVLRGEDVAFLLEAWAERLDYQGQVSSLDTFHRTIGTDIRPLVQAMYAYLPQAFVDGVPTDSYDVSSTFWTEWAADHMLEETDLDVAEDAFDSGEPLTKANMLAAFSSMKKLSTIWHQRCSDFNLSAYSEIQSMDADYPYQSSATLVRGYRSYGGESVTDSEGNVHPNAYGGWEIKFDYDTVEESSQEAAMQTEPSQIEYFANERFTHVSSGTTTNKYQFLKLGDCAIASGHASFTDGHSAQRARLIAAMDRYWGIAPGFLSTGDTLVVNMSHTPHNFIHVGSHTKWW